MSPPKRRGLALAILYDRLASVVPFGRQRGMTKEVSAYFKSVLARRSSCEAKPTGKRLSRQATREPGFFRLTLRSRLGWRMHLTTGRCFLGDDPRIKLYSTLILFAGRPAALLFSFTVFESCPQLISNTAHPTGTTAGLSTQLPAKSSLFLHKILQLSAPTVPTDTTTTTSFLPRRRKSGVPNSLPRHTTESLLPLK